MTAAARVEHPSDDVGLLARVSRFLAWEAALLDDNRFADWLDLLTDDIRYRVRCQPILDLAPDQADQPTLWYLDEDRTSLGQRVGRMADGTAWAEVPPSRTQRLVTNVLVEPGGDGRLLVRSALLLHRVRLEAEIETFAGTRHDTLRSVDGELRLADREVVLAANALPGKNLSLFL